MSSTDDLILEFAKILKYSAEIAPDIKLTTEEERIFDLLLKVNQDEGLGSTLRVAGGWVRDRLLGKVSKDIDIAIDNMTGEKFATKVSEWMKSHGMESRSVGVIKANPEQSKNLETATTFIFGQPIDFVNLRTETYTDSRIPQMQFGTAQEDADRRDLTINALFYNLNTKQVEDFTGKGISDLKNGIIRTPLDPLVTFMDDPLRILRAIRFAARYGFKIDENIYKAIKDERVQWALANKVSKDRMGIELKGMMNGPDPARALRLMKEFGIRSQIFDKPEGLDDWDMDQNNPHHEMVIWDHLAKVVETLNTVLSTRLLDRQGKLCYYWQLSCMTLAN